MFSPMRVLLILLLSVVAVPEGLAKCKARFYVISGSVVDASGAPIAGAMVGASWLQNSQAYGPALTLTDQNGLYSLPIRFDTGSGYSLWGDKCKGVLRQFSLSAYTLTERSVPTPVPVGQGSRIEVPRIQISRPIEPEPLWPGEFRAD